MRMIVWTAALSGLLAGWHAWNGNVDGGNAAWWSLLDRSDDRPAAIAIERTRHDFGTVAAGPTLKAVFPVTNRGGRRLILREHSASCDCIAGSRSEIIVEPGRTAHLEATLDTAGLGGGVQMELHYTTSDPRRPRLTLVLLAEVIES